MSKINKKYQELLHKIYYRGFEYEDPNRKGVIRKQIPYYNFEHDFEDGFSIIGLKQSYPKMAFNEMLAFMRGYANLKQLEDLGVIFWRQDAYNYYLAGKYRNENPYEYESWFREVLINGSDNDGKITGDLGKIYSHQIRNWNGEIDQLNNVLERLRRELNSTKNIVTMWNPSDLDDCCLSPCHRSFEFLAENLKNGEKGLRVKWEQSSVDTYLGLPMNILYYSFVCYVFAHYLGMKPLGIIGNLSNVHLYDNSFSAIEKLLKFNPDDLEPIQIETKFTKEWFNLDDYLRQLDFAENIKIKYYKHLGRFDIPMLPYSK
ncbi:MAG TPA: thymidylate synthase [Nitrososphaeraceae archaeon]|nr:thymidylate synthase [Nitrososphaeraceae archaeon]